MIIIMLLHVALFLLPFFNIPQAEAKCCLANFEADCGDGSHSSPCCGYKKCNGFCCACEGVGSDPSPTPGWTLGMVPQEVQQTRANGDLYTTTSVITVPLGVTWTCRDDHITKHPPRVRDAVKVTSTSGTLTTAPLHTTAAKFPGHPHQLASECGDILNRVTHGSGRVTLEQYWHYFNVTHEQDPQYVAVEAMFHARDKDNNGVLTIDEIEELLSYDDVTSSA